jgi:predicted RNase H-like nuclease (RuvC/YqgF family)
MILTASGSYTVALGADLFGNITRLDNALDGLEKELQAQETDLSNYEAQLANAKVEVEKPFPQEDELKTKSARLDELNILLNLDKQENEIVDDEKDVEDDRPVRSGPDLER